MNEKKEKWDGSQVTVITARGRRSIRCFRDGITWAAIASARFPFLAFGNEILNEGAEIIAGQIGRYVHPRD